jgi:hypothetical protein
MRYSYINFAPNAQKGVGGAISDGFSSLTPNSPPPLFSGGKPRNFATRLPDDQDLVLAGGDGALFKGLWPEFN